MKNLLFILLFCLISITLRGQWTNQTLNDPIWNTKELSGDYLIKARNNMLIGTSIITLGSIISLTTPENSYFIGIVSGFIGTTFNIVGIVYIGKSGTIHNKENDMTLRLNSTQNGMGLCLNF